MHEVDGKWKALCNEIYIITIFGLYYVEVSLFEKCHLLSLNLCSLYAFITVVYVCCTGNMNADLQCKLWCLFVNIYLNKCYRSKRQYFKALLQFSILHNFSQDVFLQEESKDPFIFFWYVPFHVWAILAVFSNLILTD